MTGVIDGFRWAVLGRGLPHYQIYFESFGIGLALLQTAFEEFRRRGRVRAGLGVDAQNPTGATRLYERAGMRVAWEAVIYQKDLS